MRFSAGWTPLEKWAALEGAARSYFLARKRDLRTSLRVKAALPEGFSEARGR